MVITARPTEKMKDFLSIFRLLSDGFGFESDVDELDYDLRVVLLR